MSISKNWKAFHENKAMQEQGTTPWDVDTPVPPPTEEISFENKYRNIEKRPKWRLIKKADMHKAPKKYGE